MKAKAIVVLSGGQDSTTCLFWARERFDLEAITFAYGQRHGSEIEAAREIAGMVGVPWTLADLSVLNQLSPSALTRSEIEVKADGGLNGLPSTFVPGRNLVFLTLASSYAIARGACHLVTGVCETDYSGYPDCRRQTIDALEMAIALGNGLDRFTIETPLMYLSKAKTVELAASYGDECQRALAKSITCYHGKRPGCGTCPSCGLRARGFAEAGFADPAVA